METALDASNRLRALGFTTDLSAARQGHLSCPMCEIMVDATSCTVVAIVRFEGLSDPDDESILFALISPCGHKGLFSCAYGQATGADASDVLRALSPIRYSAGTFTAVSTTRPEPTDQGGDPPCWAHLHDTPPAHERGASAGYSRSMIGRSG